MKSILMFFMLLIVLSACSEDSDNPTAAPVSTQYKMSLKVGDVRKYSNTNYYTDERGVQTSESYEEILKVRKDVFKGDSVSLFIKKHDKNYEKGYFLHEGVYYHFYNDKNDDTKPLSTEYLFKEQMKLGDILLQVPTGERLEVTADNQMIKVGNTMFNCVKTETFDDDFSSEKRIIYVADKVGMVKFIRERYNKEKKQYEIRQEMVLIEHNIK